MKNETTETTALTAKDDLNVTNTQETPTPKIVKINADKLKTWTNRVTSRSANESRGTSTDFDEKRFPSKTSRVYRNIAKLTFDLTGRYDIPPQQNYTILESFVSAKLPKTQHGYFHYSTPNYSLDFYLNSGHVRTLRFDARNEIDAKTFLNAIKTAKTI